MAASPPRTSETDPSQRVESSRSTEQALGGGLVQAVSHGTLPSLAPGQVLGLSLDELIGTVGSAPAGNSTFTHISSSDMGTSSASVGRPGAVAVGVIGLSPFVMAYQSFDWIHDIVGIPTELAQQLIAALDGSAEAPTTLWRVVTRNLHAYLRVNVQATGMHALANVVSTREGLWVTQAQYRHDGGRWQGGSGPRPPHEEGDDLPQTPSALSSLSSMPSVVPRRRTFEDSTLDDDVSMRTRTTARSGPGQDLPPLVALLPVTLAVELVAGSTLHHEHDLDPANEGRHALHHLMQGGYLPPDALPPLSDDPTQAWSQLRAMVHLACGGSQALVLDAASDPGGIQRALIMARAELSGVLVAQTAPNLYTVFVRESRRGHENEAGWKPWVALQTTSTDAPRFATADAAVAAYEAAGCGAHSNGLRVVVPLEPPPPLTYGRGAFIANEGLVRAELLTDAEVQGLQQGRDEPLHLGGTPPLDDPQALGPRLKATTLGAYLQEQQAGEGGCPACVINHLVQGNAVPVRALRTGTLDQTKDALRQLTGVDSSYHIVIGGDAANRAALMSEIQRSGSAMFEVGDLGTQDGRVHQLALKRMSGRNDGTGASKWVVFESGQPGKGVPASATAFSGPDGLKHALAHLAQMSHGDLSGFVPQALLRPLNGGGGIDLNEGHVRTERLSAAELQDVQRRHPGVVLQVQALPVLPQVPQGVQGLSNTNPAATTTRWVGALPGTETNVVDVAKRRMNPQDAYSLEEALRCLLVLDRLPQVALNDLPDTMLARAVWALGLTPRDDSDQGRRQALQDCTRGGLSGISLLQFLSLPAPIQEGLVTHLITLHDANPSQGVDKRARSALNRGFDLSLNGSMLRTVLPTLLQNEDILQNVNLDAVSSPFFRRWVIYAERHRTPGHGNAVVNVLGRTGEVNRQAEVEPFVGSEAKQKLAMNRAKAWFDTQTAAQWRTQAGRALFRTDDHHLSLFRAAKQPTPQVQAALVRIANAVEPQAWDGDYSPTWLALHLNGDSQTFVQQMSALMPQGQVLSTPDHQALTAYHAWFRNHYYGEGGAPGQSR